MSPPGLVDLTAWLLRTRVLCTAVCCCPTLCLQLALPPTNPDCVWPVCGLLLLPVVLAIPATLFYIEMCGLGYIKHDKNIKQNEAHHHTKIQKIQYTKIC